jgi:hypothetical protein
MASLPILLGGIGLLIGLISILLALKFAQKSSTSGSSNGGTKDDKKKKGNNDGPSKKVTLDPEADAKYILNHLRPNSTPLDILYTIATSPDNITVSTKSLELRADTVQRKLDHIKEEKRKADADAASGHSNVNATLDELLNDDDAWADDDDEDSDAVKAAKAAAELKKKQEAELNKATGKTQDDVTKVMLEGVDDNVLGMEWVKENLTEMGVWPPPGYNNNNSASQLTDPAVQRNLIMTMGRLNARQLNNHPDLLKAGPSGKIDPTYFQSTMEYRQRVGQQLEHCLRFACTIRCFQLATTILDTIVMFKIGLMDVNETKDREWFQELMVKQYGSGGTPKLIMEDKYLGVPTVEPTKADPNGSEDDKKEEEKNKLTQLIQQSRQVTTSDDKMSLEMQITRRHAEAFTKAKLEQCQRQGIPPQLAMQAYRESWFIIVRAYKLNDNDESRMMEWDGAMGGVSSNHFDILKKNNHPIFANILTSETADAFEKQIFETNKMCDNKLIVGWPFVISNVAQKTGKVKILLPTPDEAGRYEFVVTIKSQEFLGDVEEFKMVVDVAKGVEKKKDDDDEEEEGDESKKDK